MNYWNMKLQDLNQKEMEEVYRINTIAPTLLIQILSNLMVRSVNIPYIINVHAKEGLLEVAKNDKHIHTNMAKCGLAMVTKCLSRCGLPKTFNNKKISIYGCDPGWISVDEYYEEYRHWIVHPIDEIDGQHVCYILYLHY